MQIQVIEFCDSLVKLEFLYENKVIGICECNVKDGKVNIMTNNGFVFPYHTCTFDLVEMP